MSDSYEINEHDEVVPYTSGRMCTDTLAWREATELELQQKQELKSISSEYSDYHDFASDRIAELEAALQKQDDVAADAWSENENLEAENERLLTQWQAMDDELAAVSAAIRHTRWMDPPDGGDTSISEQVKRIRQDAERYRWVRSSGATAYGELVHALMPRPSEQAIDAAIDDAMHNEKSPTRR